VIAALTERSIQARPLWVPLPRLPLYAHYQHLATHHVAERIHAQGLMLPSGSTLEDDDVRRVVATLGEVLK
jgi:perosamine synthetase